MNKRIAFDGVLILGAGLAGLSAALAAAPRKVLVISTGALAQDCSSAWAQGGMAAALSEGDAPALHADDTIAAGAGLVDAEAARLWGTDRVILIPDEFLARNVARQTEIGIIAWQGRCEVHERFTAQDILDLKEAYPEAQVLAHPECPAEVLEVSDFAGSTAAMSDFVARRKPRQVVLITECSMADNVACDAPDTEFVRPCNLCPHMKRISLQNIYEALLHDRYEVTVAPEVAERARLAVQRMVDLPPPARPARYDMVKARHHVDVELI